VEFSHLGIDTFYLTITPTGSRFNCDPPVMNTDQDYLIYTPCDISQELIAAGYTKTTIDPADLQQMKSTQSIPKKGGNADETFESWRRDDINLIVTLSSEFYHKHKVAGYVCKAMNVRDKDHRIMIYHAVMYGEFDGPIPQFSLPRSKPTIDFFAINKVFST